MKIYFERSGGFAGLVMSAELDLDTLPEEEASFWSHLIDDADLFHLELPEDDTGYADGFQYTITVVQEQNERTIRLNEGYIPENLVTLVNDLNLKARYHREP